MGTAVHLLGPPRITRDTTVLDGPRGRKAWGLLAFLVLAERPPSRQRLASLLFDKAEDPRAALRWNVAEVRRALGGRISIEGDPLSYALADDINIDLLSMTTTTQGELLEGLIFDDSPAFDTWLSVERRRLNADCRALGYRRAVELLHSGQPAAAVRVATQAVERDLLNADLHAVLVLAMMSSGDLIGARAHIARCTDLFRRELGIELPPIIAAAAVPPTHAPASPATVRSLLDLADASLSGGNATTGIAQLRRAVSGVRDNDPQLAGRARLALASALIHAQGRRDSEVITLLHQAMAGAQRSGDSTIGAAVCRELAFLSVQKGHRAEAEHWLSRAEACDPSTVETSRILGVRGMSLSDAGDYEKALDVLHTSIQTARSCGQQRQVSWSLSMVGRIHLLRDENAQAAHVLDESLKIIRAERWTAFAPFPQSLRAEAAVALGDPSTARELLDYAWVQAVESGDQCWIAAVTHGQAVLALHEGRDALPPCRTGLAAAPWYVWLRARLIDLAASLTTGSPENAGLVGELEQLAGAGAMRELTVRALIHRSHTKGPQQLTLARAMAQDIANPALHYTLKSRPL